MTDTDTRPTWADFYPEGDRNRTTRAPDRDGGPVAYVADDGRYTAPGFSGVALYVVGRSQRWEPYRYWCEDPDGDPDPEGVETGRGYWCDDDDGEWCDDPAGQLWACMVGDDALHPVDAEDLSPLADDDYCSGCGQAGCGW